jgi:hypothetical protein
MGFSDRLKAEFSFRKIEAAHLGGMCQTENIAAQASKVTGSHTPRVVVVGGG